MNRYARAFAVLVAGVIWCGVSPLSLLAQMETEPADAIAPETLKGTEPPPAAPANPARGALAPSGMHSSAVSFGLVDGLVRVARGSGWVLLATPRLLVSDDEEQLVGLGLMLRRRSAPAVRETIFFRFDVRNTPGDNWYTAQSAGWEQRTSVWTGRLRGFISPHGADVVERRVIEETIQNADGSTDRLRRTFERIEIPLRGAEAEMGGRIPLPRWLGDLRLLGGFHLRDGPGFDYEDGWLTRLEYRPRERIAFELATYFNREFSQAEHFFGLRLVLPFGGGTDGNDNAFWFEPPPTSPRGDTLSGGTRTTRTKTSRTTSPPPPKPPSPPVSNPDTEPDGEPPSDPPYEPN